MTPDAMWCATANDRKVHRQHGKVEAAVIVHPFGGQFTEKEYRRWREEQEPQWRVDQTT